MSGSIGGVGGARFPNVGVHPARPGALVPPLRIETTDGEATGEPQAASLHEPVETCDHAEKTHDHAKEGQGQRHANAHYVELAVQGLDLALDLAPELSELLVHLGEPLVDTREYALESQIQVFADRDVLAKLCPERVRDALRLFALHP